MRKPGATVALVVGSLSCTVFWLLCASDWASVWNQAVLAAALILHACLWRFGHRCVFSVQGALTLTATMLVVITLIPLHHSRDLYLYDNYGRAVAEHQTSPYTNTPEQVDDETLDLVAPQWHEQRSLYGPAFVALSAVVSVVDDGDGDGLAIRLAWQSVMALAAFAAISLVARRTRDPLAVLVLGCSPVLLAAVHDAHNDVLVGVGLLALVLLLERHRHVAAGLVAAIVIATKAPAALAVLAVLAWVLWRRGPRSAARFAAPIVGVVTACYLVAGGTATITPLRESSGDDSRFAIWQPLRHSTFEDMIASGVDWHTTLETVRDRMSLYSLVLLVGCLLVVAWRFRRAARPSEIAAVTLLVLLLTSTYVMPWYPAMALPLVALTWRSRLSLVVQAQAAFVLFAYAYGAGTPAPTVPGVWLERNAVWINVALLLLTLLWVRPSGPTETRHPPGPSLPERVDAAGGAGGPSAAR